MAEYGFQNKAAGEHDPPAPAAFFPRRRELLRGYLLLLPAGLFMLVTVPLPVLAMVVVSWWSIIGYGFDTTPTWLNYKEIAAEPIYHVLITRSLAISALATIVTITLCYPIAYYVAFYIRRHKSLLLIVLTLPFWTSFLLRVFAWKMMLGYNGMVNNTLLASGLIDRPIAALLYSPTAVILVLAHSWAAFVILPIYVSLEKIDRTYLEAAADLGDGPASRFWRITFPLSMPGVLAAFLLMFIPTVGDYITPTLVGGPDGMMVGNLIEADFGPINNWPSGAALSVVTIVAIAISASAFVALGKLISR